MHEHIYKTSPCIKKGHRVCKNVHHVLEKYYSCLKRCIPSEDRGEMSNRKKKKAKEQRKKEKEGKKRRKQ